MTQLVEEPEALDSPSRIADALGLTVGAVKRWGQRGQIEPVEPGRYDTAEAAEVQHRLMPRTRRRHLARLAELL